jgi:hypothetical protein
VVKWTTCRSTSRAFVLVVEIGLLVTAVLLLIGV